MSMDLDNLYQSMENRLNDVRRERPEHEEILNFYDKVLKAQRAAQRETAVSEPRMPEDRVQLKIREGFYLVAREDFPVDNNAAKQLLQTLCQLCLEENPILATAGKNLQEGLNLGRVNFANMVAAVVRGDAEPVENNVDVNPSIVRTLVKLSIQPSLFAVAVAISRHAALDSWKQGYCPICGAFPAMAALVGEEGKRHALCSFCGHVWRLTRLSCPFCGTERHEDLRYFYGEGENLYRVQVCDHCGAYVKTVDTRKGGDVRALAVDDIATLHLDLLAEQEGYQRKAPRLLGM